jgi:methylglyoxal synthase
MATPSVGKDVLSYCGKCKLTLSHTVTAMTGTTIAKVQCNTCKAIHGFRSSPTAKERQHDQELLKNHKFQ